MEFCVSRVREIYRFCLVGSPPHVFLPEFHEIPYQFALFFCVSRRFSWDVDIVDVNRNVVSPHTVTKRIVADVQDPISKGDQVRVRIQSDQKNAAAL